MAKDPICGMEGTIQAHGHHFCSEHCAKKYEKQLAGKKVVWWREKFWIVVFVVLGILLVSSQIVFLNPVVDGFVDYLQLIWWAVLLGLFLGGVIDWYVPRDYIVKYLAQPRKRTILNAAVFGFLMSACSHGILAIAIQLYKKGASVPAVIAFLLASPWANLPITILMFGFFGVKALYLIVVAMFIAVVTGLVYQVLDRKGWIESSVPGKVKKFNTWNDVKKRWGKYKFDLGTDVGGVLSGMWALNKMVTWWILIGMTMASFARAFVPTSFFHQYMGATALGMVVTLVIATLIEVCSEGSSPLAFELYSQTGAFGNSFVFLMAGVVTDMTEIGLIWSNIGRKSAIWLPIITIPQVIFFGYLFNILL
ncbi:MAG: permease [Candidatus Nanoarchaeia archaeon]